MVTKNIKNMDSNNVKIVVFVPLSHTEVVREAMSSAGAGVIGNYTGCNFSSKGIGRFKPGAGANPTIGEIGNAEQVEEERIEMICPKDTCKQVIEALKKVHPYEEVAFDIYPLLEI
jgi:hypothetical protein